MLNLSWFWLALTALFLYGIMNFLLKVAAEFKYDSFAVLNISAAVVALLSLLKISFSDINIFSVHNELFFALINGFFFMLANVSKMSALKYAPANVIFPLTKLSIPLIFIYSIKFLGEKVNHIQIMGILLILFVFYILSQNNGKSSQKKVRTKGIVLVLFAAFFVSISVTTGKIAVMHSVQKFVYMFFSYTIVTVGTIFFVKIRGKKFLWSNRHALKLGSAIGILNFAGYYAVLTAFSKGNLSLVQPIFSLSIIIPILLSLLFYKEKMTLKKAFALALTILAINLIRK